MSETIRKLVARHPDKVEGWYKDSDGYWIDLKAGWCRAPRDEVHSVHETSVREVVAAFSSVSRCECDECRAAAAPAGNARKRK
jgi:hypothetical protein